MPRARRPKWGRPVASFLLACGAVCCRPDHCAAQALGAAQRAAAASQALVLAVQRGISLLPPTSGQTFVYEFDPSLGAPVRSERLGPVSLRTPETIAKGTFSIRGAASSFALSTTLGPIDYRITPPPPDKERDFAKFGTGLDAKVGILDFTLSYGLTSRVEMSLNLPIVVVDAQAAEVFTAESKHP